MKREKTIKYSSHRSEALIHILTWLFILGFPLLTMNRGASTDMGLTYLRHLLPPLSYGIVFYVNYAWLAPRYLFEKQKRKYFLYNVCLVIVVSILLHFGFEWLDMFRQMPFRPHPIPEHSILAHPHPIPPHGGMHMPPPRWGGMARDALMMCLPIALAASIWMSKRWGKSESARMEAERARVDAELKTLRNQLNPHFLLNTLNNIYALIEFDKEKAQLAVMELSKLLRHVLYETEFQYIPLKREIEFIQNYVALMRIRQHKGVQVNLDIHICQNSNTQVAPLIFISLIENAFKHGISSVGNSFVSISLNDTEDGKVRCLITNSNHPKNHSDKSGSGVGLEQLRWRLELLYPNNYEWKYGLVENGKVYTSELIINPINSVVESNKNI